MIRLLLTFLIVSCGTEPPQPTTDELSLKAVSAYQREREKLAKQWTTHPSGWLVPDSCDGALWSYKAASAYCPQEFNARFTEFDLGRFGRRATSRCWTRAGGDNGSKTTWSGDMGKGLMQYGIRCDLNLMLDHADYGKANAWVMGEGKQEDVYARAIYRPGLIGELYTAIYAAGGPNRPSRLIPNTYQSGLRDYHAHLQMLGIALRDEANALKRDVRLTEKMVDRIKEHFARDPEDPLFAVLYGKYTGNMEKAIDLCTKPFDPDGYYGEYVRCEQEKNCKLAHLIHACGIVERSLRDGS